MDRAVSLEARRVDLATEPPFCLGPTRIDPTGHQATVRGRSQRMQPQTLKVLIALHDKCGQAVTREELIERCWNGRVVGEDVINRCISILRRFSSEAGGFRIETVPRSGYRLIETPVAGSRSKPWRWAAMAAGLAIAAGGLYIVNEQRGQGDVDALTVAVLPLAEDSRGGDVHEVASATRASVSNDLAEGSYPASLVDQRSGAERADLIVSGDIRRAASAVEAFVQVEETRHGVVVYSHRFETDAKSANSLPDQIGASVAANLSWVATLMRLDRNRPSDPAVTAALLRAASLNVEAGDVLRAYEVARQIAPKAPNSAIAQISLASEAGSVLDELPSEQKSAAVAAGRQALDRALTLAPTFGDGYAVWCSLYGAAPIIRC